MSSKPENYGLWGDARVKGINEGELDPRQPLGAASVATKDKVYEIFTDLPIEYVNEIAVAILEQWLAFANGEKDLNGQRLMHPTGKYASSISLKRNGVASVSVIADPAIDLTAYLLETGHGPVDLKTKASFQEGRMLYAGGWAYPSQRFPTGGPEWVTVSYFVRGPDARHPLRKTGMGATGVNGNTGWVIPAMRAYSPARVFAQMARKMAQEM